MDPLPEKHLCPNCVFPLEENYKFCPSCGQKILETSDFSIKHLFLDSIGDYFHVDGKFLHTLKPMLLKPGLITCEYLKGKRAGFIPPFKLFLFISVIYFIVVGMTSGFRERPESVIPVTTGTGMQKKTQQPERNHLDFTLSFGNKTINVDSARKAIQLQGMDVFLYNIDPGSSRFTRFFQRRMLELSLEGSDIFISKLVHNASKVIFFLIPFWALLIKLIYLRRKRLYYDHLIFSLHFHSFLFLVLLVYQLITYFFFSIPIWILLLIVFSYLLIAIKRVYAQRWMKSLAKMFILIFLYLIVALPCFLFVLFLFSVFV